MQMKGRGTSQIQTKATATRTILDLEFIRLKSFEINCTLLEGKLSQVGAAGCVDKKLELS